MTWTDERVELLKKLWTDGLSASQIAGRTRRHHAQRRDRQGAPARPFRPRQIAVLVGAAPAQAAASAHDAGVAAVDARQHRARARLSRCEAEAEPELIDNIIPIGQRRTLLELNEATCRWPIGDPGHRGILLLRRQAARPAPRTVRIGSALWPRLSALRRRPTCTSTVRSSI